MPSPGKYGHVVGCPFGSLESELSQREEAVCVHARAVLVCYRRYFETALRDARAEGLICIKEIPAAARRLSAYVEGCVLQARVQNDLSLLRDLMPGAMLVIGAQTVPGPETRRNELALNFQV